MSKKFQMDRYKKCISIALAVVLTAVGILAGNVSPVQAYPNYNDMITMDKKGRMIFQPDKDPLINARCLVYLLNNSKEKTLIIPSGTELKISQVVRIGSNTTIIATGAKITQTDNTKGMLAHDITGDHYNSIQNVKIIGGTWKNAVNSYACTMFRFAHGSQLTFQNVNVETNYQGHGLELIACKNVLVDNCKILARNDKTKSSNSKEEALQIDIATPRTAPGVAAKGKKYVQGQVCQNIKVINTTVSGSRGICANFASGDPEYLNNFHRNITIENCKINGYASEGLALFNSVGCTVKNNVIKSKGSFTSSAYGDGFHMALFGTSGSSTKYANTISNNTIYGKYYSIDIISDTGCKYGKTTVSGNKLYSKGGSGRCLRVNDCTQSSVTKNTCKKW